MVDGLLRLFMAAIRKVGAGGIRVKASLVLLLVLLLLLIILAGCAPGPNQFKGTSSEHDAVAGFWVGVWQGFITPLVLVASLFKRNLNIYEVHNSGGWYNFGYPFGLACFFGGGGNRTAKSRGAVP